MEAEANGNAEEREQQEVVAMEVQPADQEVRRPAGPSNNAPSDFDLGAMTEEEQLQWALRMSMADESEEQKPAEGRTSICFNIRYFQALLRLSRKT